MDESVPHDSPSGKDSAHRRWRRRRRRSLERRNLQRRFRRRSGGDRGHDVVVRRAARLACHRRRGRWRRWCQRRERDSRRSIVRIRNDFRILVFPPGIRWKRRGLGDIWRRGWRCRCEQCQRVCVHQLGTVRRRRRSCGGRGGLNQQLRTDFGRRRRRPQRHYVVCRRSGRGFACHSNRAGCRRHCGRCKRQRR